jgi:hypothetical protein
VRPLLGHIQEPSYGLAVPVVSGDEASLYQGTTDSGNMVAKLLESVVPGSKQDFAVGLGMVRAYA